MTLTTFKLFASGNDPTRNPCLLDLDKCNGIEFINACFFETQTVYTEFYLCHFTFFRNWSRVIGFKSQPKLGMHDRNITKNDFESNI